MICRRHKYQGRDNGSSFRMFCDIFLCWGVGLWLYFVVYFHYHHQGRRLQDEEITSTVDFYNLLFVPLLFYFFLLHRSSYTRVRFFLSMKTIKVREKKLNMICILYVFFICKKKYNQCFTLILVLYYDYLVTTTTSISSKTCILFYILGGSL